MGIKYTNDKVVSDLLKLSTYVEDYIEKNEKNKDKIITEKQIQQEKVNDKINTCMKDLQFKLEQYVSQFDGKLTDKRNYEAAMHSKDMDKIENNILQIIEKNDAKDETFHKRFSSLGGEFKATKELLNKTITRLDNLKTYEIPGIKEDIDAITKKMNKEYMITST